MLPVISIIVPIYKAEKSLNKCVDSIINQTLKNIEIILIDDGSPDLCGEIADAYRYRDKRIRVIHSENKGPSFARNLGLSLAIGDFVGFVDSDDWIEETMYEELYKRAIENQSDIVMCGITIEAKARLKPTRIHTPIKEGAHPQEMIIEKVLLPMVGPQKHSLFSTIPHMLGSACTNIFRRRLIVENSIMFPLDISYAEDLLFCFSCFIKCKTMSFVDQAFYHYLYENTKSLTRGYRADLHKTLLQVHDYLDQQVRAYGLLEQCQGRLDARLLVAAQKSIVNICKSENEEGFFRKMVSIYQIIAHEKVRRTYERLNSKQLRWNDRLIFTFIKYKLTLPLFVYFKTRIYVHKRRMLRNES